MDFSKHIGLLKKVVIALFVCVVLFVPFRFLLMEVDAGFVDLSGRMRGSYIGCTGDACPCEIFEEQAHGGKYYEKLGFSCPAHVWGIGLFSGFFIYVLLVSFVLRIFSTTFSMEWSAGIVAISLLCWFLGWAILRMIFDAPIIFDDPGEGNYHIISSVLNYVRPEGLLVMTGIFIAIGLVGGLIGEMLAEKAKKISQNIKEFLRRYL